MKKRLFSLLLALCLVVSLLPAQTVVAEGTTWSLVPDASSVEEGKDVMIRTTGTNIPADLNWSVDDTDIATINGANSEATLTGVSAGNVVVTAQSASTQESATITIQVTAAQAPTTQMATVTILGNGSKFVLKQNGNDISNGLTDNINVSVPVGSTLAVEGITVEDWERDTQYFVSWTANRVECGNDQAMLNYQIPAEGVTFEAGWVGAGSWSIFGLNTNVSVGDTATATVEYSGQYPANPVTWSSNNTAVATVDTTATGPSTTVNFLADGVATISAQFGDDLISFTVVVGTGGNGNQGGNGGNHQEPNMNIDGNGGTFTMKDGRTTDGCGFIVPAGQSLNNIQQSVSDAVFWNPDRAFLGWMPYIHEQVTNENGETYWESVPIPGASVLTTADMLAYPANIDGKTLNFVAQWDGDEDDYYNEVRLNALDGEFKYGNDYWDGMFDSYQDRFRLNGKTFGENMESWIRSDPTHDQYTFQGWLEYKMETGELVSETVYSTAQVSAMTVPGYDVMFVAKWDGIFMDDYKTMFQGGNQGGEPNVEINANHGEVLLHGANVSFGAHGINVTPGLSMNEANEKIDDPVYWDGARQFDGWIVEIKTELTDDEGNTYWTYVQVPGTGLMTTNQMLDYKTPADGTPIRFFAQWAGNDSDYISDVGFETLDGILTMVHPDGNSEQTTAPGHPCLKNGSKISDQIDWRISDPVHPNFSFEGWLMYEEDPRTLVSEQLYTTAQVFDMTVPNYSVRFVAKWSGISMDDYKTMFGGGSATVPPTQIQVGGQIAHNGAAVYEFTPNKTAAYVVYFEHSEYSPSVSLHDSTGTFIDPKDEFGYWMGGKNYITGYRWDLQQGETYTLPVDGDEVVGTVYLEESVVATDMEFLYTMEGYAPYGMEAKLVFDPIYAEAPGAVSYTIGNTDVAAIDGSYLKLLTPGTTTITATSGSLTATANINVLAPVTLPLGQAVAEDASAAGNLRYSFTVTEAGNYAFEVDADVIQVPEEGIDVWVEDMDGNHVRQWFTAKHNPCVLHLEPGTYELVCRSYDCEITAKVEATDDPVTEDDYVPEEPPQVDENDYANATCNGDIAAGDEKQVQLTWEKSKQYYTFTPEEDGNYLVYTTNMGDGVIINLFEAATDEHDAVKQEKNNWEMFAPSAGWFNVFRWDGLKAGTTYDLVFMGDGYTVDFALDAAPELESISFLNDTVEAYEYETVSANIVCDPILAYPGDVTISVIDQTVARYEEENNQIRLLAPGTTTVTARSGNLKANMSVTVLDMPAINLGTTNTQTNAEGRAAYEFVAPEDGEYVFLMNCSEPISVMMEDAYGETDFWQFWKWEANEQSGYGAQLQGGMTYVLYFVMDETENNANIPFTMEIFQNGGNQGGDNGPIIPEDVTPTELKVDKTYAQSFEEEAFYTFTAPAAGYYALKTDASDRFVEVTSNVPNTYGAPEDVLSKDLSFAMKLDQGQIAEFRVVTWEDANIWLEEVTPITKLEVTDQDTSVVYPNGVYIMPFHTLKDVELKVTFADGKTQAVDGNEVMETSAICGFPIDIGIEDATGKVTVKCCDAEAEYTLKLEQREVTGITADFTPPFDFYENDYGWLDDASGNFIYDAEMLAVWEADYTLTFSDGSTETFNLPAEGQAQYRGVNLDIMNDQMRGNYWSVGTNTIELDYGGKSVSIDVEIKANPVDSIELLEIGTMEYVLGDPEYFELTDEGWCMTCVDMTSFKLQVNFKDGTSKVLTGADMSTYTGIANQVDLLDGLPVGVDFEMKAHTGAGTNLVGMFYMGYAGLLDVDIVEPAEDSHIHDLVVVEEQPAYCYKPGHVTHYKCNDCGKVFSIDNPEVELDTVEVRAPHGEPVAIPAKAATCDEDGNIAYYQCSTVGCGKLFADILCKEELSAEAIVVKAAHKPAKVEAVAATCKAAGTKEHYKCATCGKLFADAEAKTAVTAEELATELATAHTLKSVETVDATYTAPGVKAHYACAVCGEKFADAEGNTKVTDAELEIAQLIEVVGDKAEVSEGAVDKAIEDAVAAGDKKDVVLDLTQDEVVGEVTTPVTKTEIPVAAVEKVADAGASLTLTKEDATVTLDKKALAAVVAQAGEAESITLVVEEVKTEELTAKQQEAVEKVAKNKTVAKIISAELLVQTAEGQKNIGTEADKGFGGGTVTVKIPFTPETGYKGSDYVVIYVADDGTVERINTKYKDGCLVVDLKHFSDYVIVNDAEQSGDNAGGTDSGEAQPEETKPGVSSGTGSGSSKPTGNAAPATGDNANIFGLVTLLVVSGLLAVAFLALRKKQCA